MIYADSSFFFSLYCLDDNSALANKTYLADRRRPLFFTPWQHFELKNTVRLAVHRLRRAGRAVPFEPGNVFRHLESDVRLGILRHAEPDWRETFDLAEEISSQHTEKTGAGSVDTWHVAAATLLRADTFLTSDAEQRKTAISCGEFRQVPNLLKV